MIVVCLKMRSETDATSDTKIRADVGGKEPYIGLEKRTEICKESCRLTPAQYWLVSTLQRQESEHRICESFCQDLLSIPTKILLYF